MLAIPFMSRASGCSYHRRGISLLSIPSVNTLIRIWAKLFSGKYERIWGMKDEEIRVLKAKAALADRARVMIEHADVDGSTEEAAAELLAVYADMRDWIRDYDSLT
jgi:hypothetical protein